MSLARRLDEHVATLAPSSFAFVMATGIVSIGARLLHVGGVDVALLAINIVAYIVLWVLTLWRAAAHRDAMVADLLGHRGGVGFLTTVAATGVLGSQMVVIANDIPIATGLLIFAAALWFVLLYSIFTILTVKEDKPSLADGINGGWLLVVVSTQSLAVLLALLSPEWAQPLRLHANFLALATWLGGGMLYIWIISLIFYRYMFFHFSPTDLEPPYWINMGAMAISVLAGALLIRNVPDAPFLRSLRPFLEGFTVFYWATGTWWIPIMVILAVWRYAVKRLPLVYEPLYWGAVFPLGMYAVATYRMAHAMSLGFLNAIPEIFFWIALVCWLAAFVGMSRRVVGVLVGTGDAAPGS